MSLRGEGSESGTPRHTSEHGGSPRGPPREEDLLGQYTLTHEEENQPVPRIEFVGLLSVLEDIRGQLEAESRLRATLQREVRSQSLGMRSLRNALRPELDSLSGRIDSQENVSEGFAELLHDAENKLSKQVADMDALREQLRESLALVSELKAKVVDLEQEVELLQQTHDPAGSGGAAQVPAVSQSAPAPGMSAVSVGATASAGGGGTAQSQPSGGPGVSVSAGNNPCSSAAAVVTPAPARPSLLHLKPKDLKKLGKEKDELPYYRWKQAVGSTVRAAGGNRYLGELDLTGLSADDVEIHEQNDAILYSALYGAVAHVTTLGDKVGRVGNSFGSAAKAWEMIKAFYVRLGEHNESFLDGKLAKLAPGEGESMEVFLNRCERLRSEYESYGLVLEDSRLLRQVKQKLSMSWLQATGLSKVDATRISWEDASYALQLEDNTRRQANTDAVDALLPLGWKPQGGAKAKAHAASGEPKDPTPSPTPAPAHAAPAVAGKGPAKGKGPGKGAAPKGGTTFDKSQWVCYYCIEVGHGVNECPTKPAGWKPTPESRKLVADKKAELAKAKEAKATHPSV